MLKRRVSTNTLITFRVTFQSEYNANLQISPTIRKKDRSFYMYFIRGVSNILFYFMVLGKPPLGNRGAYCRCWIRWTRMELFLWFSYKINRERGKIQNINTLSELCAYCIYHHRWEESESGLLPSRFTHTINMLWCVWCIHKPGKRRSIVRRAPTI